MQVTPRNQTMEIGMSRSNSSRLIGWPLSSESDRPVISQSDTK